MLVSALSKAHTSIQAVISREYSSSFRSRLKGAFPLMKDTERIAIGYTYNWVYGISSEAIHYRSNRTDYRIRPDELMFNIRRLGLLINLVLDRCYRLLDKPDAPRFSRISESLEHSDSLMKARVNDALNEQAKRDVIDSLVRRALLDGSGNLAIEFKVTRPEISFGSLLSYKGRACPPFLLNYGRRGIKGEGLLNSLIVDEYGQMG